MDDPNIPNWMLILITSLGLVGLTTVLEVSLNRLSDWIFQAPPSQIPRAEAPLLTPEAPLLTPDAELGYRVNTKEETARFIPELTESLRGEMTPGQCDAFPWHHWEMLRDVTKHIRENFP